MNILKEFRPFWSITSKRGEPMFGNGIKLTSDLKIESPRQNPANEVRRGGGQKGL